MSKKLFNKKWSELTDKQKKRFSSKSDFLTQKRESNLTPKKDAVLAIQQDKGKLKPADVNRISSETGLSAEKIKKLAVNRVPDKVIKDPSPKKAAILAIQQDKGKLKPRDAERISNETGLSIKKILKITGNKVPDKVISGKLKTDKGDKGKDKKDTTIKDLKSDLEEAESKIKDFPGADGEKVKGKDFKKYKPQAKKIREAAEADLALRLAKKTEPKTLEKAENLKSKFEEGRTKREKQLAKIGDAKRPKFKDYKQAVKDIRKGRGAAKEYAYSGKFEKLGKKLGVKYGEQKREKRTERRFASLMEGLKNKKLGRAYSTAADDAKTQRKKGRKAMKLFRGESVA